MWLNSNSKKKLKKPKEHPRIAALLARLDRGSRTKLEKLQKKNE